MHPEHRTHRTISPGVCYPLGATPQPGGVNFALYSRRAEAVYLHLFDQPDAPPTDVIRLPRRTRFIWHGFVHGVAPGQLYGYKVTGAYDPGNGDRFNPHKLVIDPYARGLVGQATNPDNLLLAYDPASPDGDLSLDTRDNTRVVPKAIVLADDFDWQGDTPPGIPFEKLIVYEVHLKGFTAHPSSGVRHPGTYLGFIEKIPHLVDLGVNAVELLPVHAHYVEDFLRDRGLTNYWGYNTLGFFTPEPSYGTRSRPAVEVDEFKTLVRALHRAGIELILDVVYNHSAEGNERGPTLSFRGIDNRSYYLLSGEPGAPARYYMNYSGCGNSLDLSSPPVLRLVLDSLRYWVEAMHVDGFRFDLASVLGREDGTFRKTASFFDTISQDPVLSRVKLIAEPWDLGSYQVGDFPVDWAEWNGRFRDTMRRFAKGDGGVVHDVGRRFTGSADLYADDGRSAWNSINFITCHDGFTLRDLVSYNEKHNEANREENRDGSNDNLSWNSGAEGETGDPAVLRLRRQIAKNHACHLLFAAGTPMLTGGDEIFRTQRGNNNAYCQDSEISWFDWEEAARNADVLDFFRKTIALTKRYPILQRRKFFIGEDNNRDQVPDIAWYGTDLAPPPWSDPDLRTLCVHLDGGEEESAAGDYKLFLILNADPRLQHVRLPPAPAGRRWRRVLDTSLPAGEEIAAPGAEVLLDPQDLYLVNPRSTVLLVG